MSTSHISNGSNPDEPPLPPVINQIMVRLGAALDELSALLARQMPGFVADEVLEQALNVLTRATTRLLGITATNIALQEQLEEQTRQREVNMHPLGEIPPELGVNDLAAYLRDISRQLYQLQQRMVDTRDRLIAIAEQTTEVGEHQIESEHRLGLDLEQGFDEMHNHLRARDWTKFFKLRSRPKDENLRRTSANHQRKVSFPQSVQSGKSGKSLRQRAVEKTTDFFRRPDRSSHSRRNSDADILQRASSMRTRPSDVSQRQNRYSSPLNTGE